MPVTPNKKYEMPERREFEAIPADMYQAQVTDITEKLKAPYGKPFDIPEEEKEEFLSFEFTILDEGEYRGRKLWKDLRPVPPTPPEGNFKPSLMFRVVSAIQGQPTVYANAVNWGGEETNALIGQQLRLIVTRTEKGDKVYNNITEFLPVKQALEPVDTSNRPQQTTAHTPSNAPTGRDKFAGAASNLPGAKPPETPAENVAPDIQEYATQLEQDVDVSDIPF